MLWLVGSLENSVQGAHGDSLHLCGQVLSLEVLNLVEHRDSSVVEGGLSVQLAVGKEVDEGPLLDKLVLSVDSVLLELLLGVAEVLVLLHFGAVSPHVGHLDVLVVGVGIVKDGELGTNHESEVPYLNPSDVKSDKELVVPDHSSKPIVVLPTSESGDSVD